MQCAMRQSVDMGTSGLVVKAPATCSAIADSRIPESVVLMANESGRMSVVCVELTHPSACALLQETVR